MKVSIIASTKIGYQLPINEALDFGGKSAGICYMPNTFDEILNEPAEKTQARVNLTLNNAHHSVYDHPTYNLLLEDIPKILAMVLNNECMYTTSEKSARYTRMNPSPKELELYNKWIEIFEKEIQNKYPKIKSMQVTKLAQENARYMISVFTPTTMEYTASFRQINYIRYMMQKYIEEEKDTNFTVRLKQIFKEFLKETEGFAVEGLDCAIKNRRLSLFDSVRTRSEEFGETYCTTYYGTFAMLAQAQRHRTLQYKMLFNENEKRFYVPMLIRAENQGNSALEEEWLADITSIADFFPQGTLVRINERGTYENFMLKCMERLCGCSQLEIMIQTRKTLQTYIKKSGYFGGLGIDYILKGYGDTPRCKFPDWKCKRPCIWGPNEAFNRLI